MPEDKLEFRGEDYGKMSMIFISHESKKRKGMYYFYQTFTAYLSVNWVLVNTHVLLFFCSKRGTEWVRKLTSFYLSIYGLSQGATLSLCWCLFLSSVLWKQTKGAGSYPCSHSVSWLKGIKVPAVCCSLIDCRSQDSSERQVGHTQIPGRKRWQNRRLLRYQVAFFVCGKMTHLSDTSAVRY